MLVADTEYEALKLFGGIETTRRLHLENGASACKAKDFPMCNHLYDISSISKTRHRCLTSGVRGVVSPIRSVEFVRVRPHCLKSPGILEPKSSETARSRNLGTPEIA